MYMYMYIHTIKHISIHSSPTHPHTHTLLTPPHTHSEYTPDVTQNDIVLQGYGHKLGSTIFSKWERKYFVLYPNRIQWADSITVSPLMWLLSNLSCGL